jgi:hypothetical protein
MTIRRKFYLNILQALSVPADKSFQGPNWVSGKLLHETTGFLLAKKLIILLQNSIFFSNSC